MHMDRSVEFMALNTFLTSFTPDELASLSPGPVSRVLMTGDGFNGLFADPIMDD